jgi:hypothetical protein
MLAIVLSVTQLVNAQVTTASITGSVKAASGEFLVGATITATHLPSGSVYTTIAKKDGVFNLPGLRIGGPYTVKVDFVGQTSQTFENISLQLGEAYNLNAILGQDEKELTGVVVTGRSRRGAPDRGGMSSTFNNRVLTTLPTISRSITDFTRATPQANGNSFGGRDAKLNNITVDGANLNNNFGLSDDPLPGAGNNPVSLDAIEEVSVSLSPFDVKQGNFTGGNIAAITKSGTNTFHGTAYTYWQNQNLIGYKAGDARAAKVDFKSNIFGASVGGPIIKNKLFFFINGEFEKKPPASGVAWTPNGGSGAGNISDVPVDSLAKVSNYLKGLGYDPGVYDNFPAFKNENHKILAKIDWNINQKHKLTAKYSDFGGEQDFQPSQSGNIGGTQSGVTYGPKYSKSAMAFSSVNYVQKDVVRSGALELNSNFSSRISNQFLVTYTKISSDKTHNGANFPFVDILGATPGDMRNFISFGNEPFNGNNNKVINDVLSITNNFSYFAGKHALTAGVSYEYQKVGNMFMRGSTGYYIFRSVDDFVNNRAPLKYAQTYSLIPGEDAVFSAELKIGQLSGYIQDEYTVNPKVKITMGLRIDKPMYLEDPLENPANSALNFQNINKQTVNYSTGVFPKASPLFSPRVGFRYDIEGDKSLILRGGTGIFTGRVPYVYLTNIPTNSGMYQYSANVNASLSGVNMNNYLFNPNPNAYNPFYTSGLPTNYFPTTAGSVASADFVVTERRYKFPQVWRSNLGIDHIFAKNWKLSVDVMYTKDINATYMFNANQSTPTSTVTTGDFTRTAFSANNNAARRINGSITNAMVLDRTNKGQSFVLTAGVSRSFANGLYASLAYNYTFAQDVTANPGSQASSIWNANPTSNTLNDFELANSSFATPHRVVATLSYRKEYLKHLATTVSFFYEGRNQGRYSYIYNGDLNYDGYNMDLMYVPTDARNTNQIRFREGVVYNGVTYTAAQQAEIFENFISQDPYLSKHRGQVTERNGALYPWYNRLDAKIVQDVFTNIGPRKHSLQFSVDCYNFLNLLNKDWGVRKLYTVNNPLRVESITNGIPTFSITSFNNAPVTTTFIDNVATSTTWALQLGVRYIF